MAPVFESNFIHPSDMLEGEDIKSPIKNYVKNKKVFLTGGFGFLGKLLIEILLRCQVGKVYLFVRGKKGCTSDERFDKLKKEPVSSTT